MTLDLPDPQYLAQRVRYIYDCAAHLFKGRLSSGYLKEYSIDGSRLTLQLASDIDEMPGRREHLVARVLFHGKDLGVSHVQPVSMGRDYSERDMVGWLSSLLETFRWDVERMLRLGLTVNYESDSEYEASNFCLYDHNNGLLFERRLSKDRAVFCRCIRTNPHKGAKVVKGVGVAVPWQICYNHKGKVLDEVFYNEPTMSRALHRYLTGDHYNERPIYDELRSILPLDLVDAMIKEEALC